jgi:hypothetical protein
LVQKSLHETYEVGGTYREQFVIEIETGVVQFARPVAVLLATMLAASVAQKA